MPGDCGPVRVGSRSETAESSQIGCLEGEESLRGSRGNGLRSRGSGRPREICGQSPAALVVDRRRSAIPWSRDWGLSSSMATTIVLAFPWCAIERTRCPMACERVEGGLGPVSALEGQDVGEPLVMGPRGVDGLSSVQAELHEIEHDPERGVGDGPSSRRAGDDPHSSVFEHERRSLGAEHPLVGLDPVGRRSDPAAGIGPVRDQVEVAHLVIEQEPRPGDHALGAVGVLEGIGQSPRRCRPGRRWKDGWCGPLRRPGWGTGPASALGVACSPIDRAS